MSTNNQNFNCAPNPLVSIIVLNYNDHGYLKECLTSLIQTDYENFELIVVDNGSTNGNFKEIIKDFRYYPNFKTICLERNYGYAAGNNIAISKVNASSKYLVFMNNDIKVNSDWLKPLVKVMEEHSKVGIAQPKLLLMGDQKTFDCAGGFIDRLGFAHERCKHEQDRGQCDNISEIFYAKGAAFIIKTNLWKQLKGFENIFSLYYEETDLCWRLRLLGYKVIFFPGSKVFHASGITIKKFFDQKILYYESRNRLITLISNYGFENLKYVPFSIVWLFVILIYVDLWKNKFPKSAYFRIQGLVWCFKNLRWIYKRRVYVQSTREVNDKCAIEKVLLKWEYVFGKRL